MNESKDECCDERPCCAEEPSHTMTGLEGMQTSGIANTTIHYSNGCGSMVFNEPNMQKSKIKDVIIKEMDHGYLVKIGCQTLCIESPKTLLKALKKYLKDPDAVENQHMGGEFMDGLKD